MAPPPPAEEPWVVSLRKYLLLLATVVATVTYSAGFNPPGGVWQDTAGGHLAGDPIIRDTHYTRYAFFFYSNTSALASSLLVAVLILLLAVLHEKKVLGIDVRLLPLRVVMVLDLISLTMAYAAGTCRDRFTRLYFSLLMASVLAYLIQEMVLDFLSRNEHVVIVQHNNNSNNDKDKDTPLNKQVRKILMLLATFAVSLTYLAGLNTPGGFWDNTENGHRPGDAILREHHQARLTAFFVCNTTAFVASLFIIVLLLDKKLHKTGIVAHVLYGCIIVALIGLVGAYAVGSNRKITTTIYVLGLVVAVLICILLLQVIIAQVQKCPWSRFWSWLTLPIVKRCKCLGHEHNKAREEQVDDAVQVNARKEQIDDMVDKARSLVLLLATLAATITYQAGLDPPGGVWQKNEDGHIAGDPILLTTNPKRYKAFFYCNSVAFVASLVVIVLVQKKLMLRHHVLEAAMVLDLFGLIGAYAAGTCRDVSTSIYVIAMAGVVLVYVVIHIIFFTLDHRECDEQVEKRRKRLLLFAILAATITYQAGLTPPSGFLLQDNESTGHHAGDPILMYNSALRYKAFFYCNSASFMLSMALIILLVNPNLYRPAIRSYALSVCTAVGLFGLVGAYAAGSTQHRRTSISIIVMASVLLLALVLLLLVFFIREQSKKKDNESSGEERRGEASHQEGVKQDGKISIDSAAAAAAAAPGSAANYGEEDQKKKKEKEQHLKRKYLMLLGILVASVTYQAGLDQPGGVWQSTGDGHNAGSPAMRDSRRRRYRAFFYCNSTAFMASIVVIILLLPWVKWLKKKEDWWFRVMSTTIMLDLLALLGAYAIGSSRKKETSIHVTELIFAVLAYVAVYVTLSLWRSRRRLVRPSVSQVTRNTACLVTPEL